MNKTVPAIRVIAKAPLNITQYWNGLFTWSTSEVKSYYPAVSCLEKFQNEDQAFLNQFVDEYANSTKMSTTGWLCPDIDEMQL